MKREKGYIEFNNGIIISYWQTITEIFHYKDFNWNTWQFLNVEFENDILMGGYEFIFVFLCCGLRIRIPHKTEKSIEEYKKLNNITKGLKNSCYAWTTEEEYNNFKSKKKTGLLLWNKRKYVPKDRSKYKKLFIQ